MCEQKNTKTVQLQLEGLSIKLQNLIHEKFIIKNIIKKKKLKKTLNLTREQIGYNKSKLKSLLTMKRLPYFILVNIKRQR